MKRYPIYGLVVILVIAAFLIGERATRQSSDSVNNRDVVEREKKGEGKQMTLPCEPNNWFYFQRAWPNDIIPQEKYVAALKEVRAQRASYKPIGPAAVTWENTGPINIPGRISAIAVHPSAPNTIYAGAAAGGVYKSEDLGVTWTPIFDDVGTFSIGDIAIDPIDPNTIYVGTGEATIAIDDYEGTGVYKSTDGGATWVSKGLELSGLIGRITILPNYPDTLYVATVGKGWGFTYNTDHGLYRSQDGGDTWENILMPDNITACIDVALHPSGVVLAAMYRVYSGSSSAIWRSDDYGDTFTKIQGTGGLPPQGDLGRIGLTIDPHSSRAYALHVDGSTQDLLGLYRSDDLGLTWTQTNDGILEGTFGYFAWYFGQIRVTPGYPDIVYSLGVQLYKSTDGGGSWFEAGYGTHVDHHAMTILDGSPDEVYLGCDGGVNYTSNGGSDWTVFTNMPNTQFYAMTVDYNNPERIYGGTQDNGTMRTMTGSIDDWERIIGADGFQCRVDYTNPDIIYGETQNGGLRKSTDGGYYFYSILDGIDGGESRGWNTPFEMDPNNPQVLYYGTNRLYKTTNGGGWWNAISNSLTGSYLTAIGVAKSDDQVLYVGSASGDVSVTQNGGASWTTIDAVLPDRFVTRITVDPDDAGKAYVTLSGYMSHGESLPHIFRTYTYGDYWQNLTSNLPEVPLSDIIIDPEDNTTLYLATDVGVYVTYNDASTWQVLGDDMPITCVIDLELHAPSRELVAATHGRSIFKTMVPCPAAGDGDSDGICDQYDNCPDDPNTDQIDTDEDGIGDVCEGCCGQFTGGITGNANCSEDGKLTLSDITRMIDRVYVSRDPLCCEATGNTNGSADCKISLSDITVLIDAVYISETPPAACMPECEI